MGLKRGDVVAYLLKDCVEAVEIMYAVNKIGGIRAPVNYRFTAEEMERQVLHLDEKVFFFEEEFTGHIEEIKRNLPRKSTTSCTEQRNSPALRSMMVS